MLAKSGNEDQAGDPIDRRSYSGRFIMGRKDVLPICFKAALVIAASCFVSRMPSEAKDSVNSVSIVRADRTLPLLLGLRLRGDALRKRRDFECGFCSYSKANLARGSLL